MGEKNETPTIEIDMDKECERCHEMGAGKGGLCLGCVAEKLKKARFKAVGVLAIRKAKAEICAMLDEYHDEIDKAYIKADGDLTVALGLKMKGTRMAGEIHVTASINFVESRVKHSVEFLINEKQMGLPGVK